MYYINRIGYISQELAYLCRLLIRDVYKRQVLNSTNAEQVVANNHYRIMTNDSKSGKELISGKKIDLTKNMTVGARPVSYTHLDVYKRQGSES